jgi:exopolyphosphatase/guanosine-5'-triphosphate,3'-diphosphate pyrophosphatase
MKTPDSQSMQTVNKVKQKVRLAAGLDENLYLSNDVIMDGLNCLKLFAKHLVSIPPDNISIVATAALRIAKNNDVFFQAANKILPKKNQIVKWGARSEYYLCWCIPYLGRQYTRE